MSKKKTHEEFLSEVFDLTGNEFEIIGIYINNHTKIKIRHNCDKCNNYEYSVTPANFLQSLKCPKCSGKMKKTHSEFIQNVFDKVSSDYTVLSEYINIKTKVLIQHNSPNCNYHSYYTTPNNFLNNNRRCPICFGKNKKTQDGFVKEIYDKAGDEYSVLGEYIGANKNILFRHNSDTCDNYEFLMTPSSFITANHRCPQCARNKNGALKGRTHNEFCVLVKEMVGNEYEVIGRYNKAHIKLRIKHNNIQCNNYEWDITPDSFLCGTRCPKCKESKGERKISDLLYNKNIIFKQQYRFNDCRNKKPLPFDFAIFDNQNNLYCLIEFQGKQHNESIAFFGGDEQLQYVQGNDEIKRNYCSNNNIKYIEIKYDDFDNIDAILNLNLYDIMM